MKPKTSNPFIRRSSRPIAIAVSLIAVFSAHAAVFTWDSDGVFSNGVTPGSGTWNTTSALWNNGTADVVWTNGNAATFSGADGSYVITLANAVTAGANGSGTGAGLVFLNGSNTISAAAPITLTIPTSNSSGGARTTANSAIWVAADKTATIGSDVTLAMTGSSFGQGVALDSGATLNINSTAKIDKTTNGNRDLLFGGVSGAASPSTLNVFGTINRSVASDTAALVFGVWGGALNVDVEDGGVINTASDGSTNSNGSIVVGQTSGPVGVLTLKPGVTGGTVTSANLGTHAQSGIKLAKDSGSSGTVNLDGGTLSAFKIFAGSGTSTLNLNGGTLKPVANNTTNFVNGLTRVNVRDGGAKIDTNGFDVTIPQSLLHSDILEDAETDGGLTKSGAGRLTLMGSNQYTGPTTVNGGILALDVAATLMSNITVNSGGTLASDGLNFGTVTFNSGSTLLASTGGNAILADGFNFTGPTTLSFSGPTLNGETYDLFYYGANGVTGLSNLSSTFRTTLFNDTVAEKVTGTVMTGNRTWNTTSGTWEIGGTPTPWAEGDKKFFNGDSVVFNNPTAPSTITLTGNLLPSGVTVNNTTNAYTFSGTGSISGITTLAKSGNGTLNIDTVNSYTGSTDIGGGTVNLNGSLNGTSISVLSGAALNVSSTGLISGVASLIIDGTVVLASANNYTGTTIVSAGGVLRIGDGTNDGSITSPSVSNDGSVVFNNSAAQTYTGQITGTGTLTKEGFGTLTLSNAAAGSHSGGTTVSEGTVIAHSNVFNGGALAIAEGATVSFVGTGANSTSTVTGGGSINNTEGEIVYTGDHSGFTGTLTTSGNTQFASGVSGSPNADYTITGGLMIFGAAGDYTVKFGSLSGTGGTIRGANAAAATGTTTLEVGARNLDTSIVGTFSNGGTKVLALTKVGTGKLTFTGNKTYTGPTAVNGGTLQVNGLSGSVGVTVNSGGTFAGTGTVAGSVTVNSGGTIAPGPDVVGTLTTGATFIDGSYAAQVDGAVSDTLAVNGNLDIDGATLNVSVLPGGTTQAQYIIATYTGTLTGTFNVGTPLPAGYTVDYGTTGQIKLVGTPASGYGTWASSFGLDPGTDGAAGVDKEGDGFLNGTEYILGGSPVSGSENPKIYSLVADSDDGGTENELVLTIAVPQGTPAFTAGAPTSTATFDGFNIIVRGGGDLASFLTTVNPVAPVTTGLPGAPVIGGVTYEYRSFSLSGSNNTPGKGFLQVQVNPVAP